MIFQKMIAHFLGSYILREFKFAKTHYRFSLKKSKPMVIYNHDSRFNDNGLADKIRGMVSAYAFAKANNMEFRINHIEPFHLEDYFVPNDVNWRVRDNELSYNWFFSWPIIILDYEKGDRIISYKRRIQYHFYSNVNFIKEVNQFYFKNYSFSQLFNELFVPSQLLLNSVQPFFDKIKEGYISISFRFMQLMGDFHDVRGKTLSLKEQKELSLKCIALIESIHAQYPEIHNVFVTSDSTKFMKCVQSLDFVFQIPGKISHLGFNATADACLKTFVDYYMISKAQRAFLGLTGDMYKSNFAKSAAEVNNVPFEIRQF